MKSSIVTGLSALVLTAGMAFGQCGSQTTKANYAAKDGCEAQKACDEKSGSELVAASFHDHTDIVDTAVKAGNFKTLAKALEAAGLVDALKGKGPFTVFAPTDEAFAKLGTETLNTLLRPENKARLANILKFHVVSGNVTAADVVKLSNAETLAGQRVKISARDGKVTVNGANVTATDVKASNGVIHVIDTVILPSDKNVVQTAVDAGTFKTLAELLTAADLVKTLSGEGPFTVFAPTDAAFAKLPAGTIEGLKKDKEALKKVLTYHVVGGSRIFSDAAIKAGKAATVQGQEVTITMKDGKVMVNNATVVTPDIDALNGVIHVIDTVILPK
jgi:uncharacterized surface protein with fasciclin (FAS1) repeats